MFSVKQEKQFLILEAKALINLGEDRNAVLEAIESGVMDEEVQSTQGSMKTAHLLDMLTEIEPLLPKANK